MKLDRKEQEDSLSHVEAELAKYDQTEEVQDYQDQLEKATQALLGWYLVKLEGLEKDKQKLKFQLSPILSQIGQDEQNKKDLVDKEKELRDTLSKIAGVLDSRSKDIERLKQQLLANPDQEQVKDELDKWQERVSISWMKKLSACSRKENCLFSRKRMLFTEKKIYKNSTIPLKRDRNKINYELSAMKNAQRSLIDKLASLRPQWAALENIYLTQDSVKTRLIETIDKLKKDRNTLLYRERVAHRFSDDYGSQTTFFGDAYLEEQLASWKNQFDYLVTGVEYLEAIDDTERKAAELSFMANYTSDNQSFKAKSHRQAESCGRSIAISYYGNHNRRGTFYARTNADK